MTRNILILIIVAVAVLALRMVAGAKPGEDEKRAARKKMKEGAVVLDVRTGSEFASGHVPGATNIPVQELSGRLSELGEDKARPIVVYCRSGNRSTSAKQILVDAGYTNVLNAGGLGDVNKTD
jgi:phage shock protein E